MRKAIEQETLVEIGAAREFRALREVDVWQLELRLCVKSCRSAHGANRCVTGTPSLPSDASAKDWD